MAGSSWEGGEGGGQVSGHTVLLLQRRGRGWGLCTQGHTSVWVEDGPLGPPGDGMRVGSLRGRSCTKHRDTGHPSLHQSSAPHPQTCLARTLPPKPQLIFCPAPHSTVHACDPLPVSLTSIACRRTCRCRPPRGAPGRTTACPSHRCMWRQTWCGLATIQSALLAFIRWTAVSLMIDYEPCLMPHGPEPLAMIMRRRPGQRGSATGGGECCSYIGSDIASIPERPKGQSPLPRGCLGFHAGEPRWVVGWRLPN